MVRGDRPDDSHLRKGGQSGRLEVLKYGLVVLVLTAGRANVAIPGECQIDSLGYREM
jgi:hypothetical protein